MRTYNEFLGLCPIGAEVAFNNELKLNGFVLSEKFPGRLFFKEAASTETATQEQYSRKAQTQARPRRSILIKNFVQANIAAENLGVKTTDAPSEKDSTGEKAKAEVCLSSGTSTNVSSRDYALVKSIIKANLKLRLADRIGLVIAKFRCEDFDDLFEGVGAVDWTQFFCEDSKVGVEKVSSAKSKLASERAIQSVAAKAIYTTLCKAWHVNTMCETGDTFSVRIYLDNDVASVVLDTSGEPLHKRGYRLSGGIAPIRETAAALLLQLMMWKRKMPLHDPFCGSGTIPIEAILYAHNVAPGFLREEFDFQKFALFRGTEFRELLQAEKAKAADEIQTGNVIRITGSDIDENAVSLSQANAENACALTEAVMRRFGRNDKLTRPDFVQADIAEIAAPYAEGVLLGNPPYGERLGDEAEALDVYRKIADAVQEFPRWQKAFITNKTEFPDTVREVLKGQRFREHAVKYGKLETVLYVFR